MNRNTIRTAAVTVLALTALSGTAIAQHQSESPRDCVRLAERSDEMNTSLAEAITLVEKHTQGVVIGIRLTTDEGAFRTDANGLPRSDHWSRGARIPAFDRGDREGADRNDAQRRSARRSTQQAGRSWESSEPMFAIVTCVIDRARVRDVVVDMTDGTVLGMQSMYAGGSDARDGESWDMYADRSRFTLVRASDLMNASARNGQGERVGDIDELVIDPDSDRIVYGVLRRGGFLGFNESRYAISTSELSAPKDGRIMLELSSSDFEGRSGFDNDRWPTKADPEWSSGWNQSEENLPSATRILKATDLIGSDVRCSEGQKVGEISDLIVEPGGGRVVYAIVSADRGRIVVPMSVVRSGDEGRVMNMTHDEVMALPTLGAGTEPDWNDARWNRRIHDNFDARMDLTTAPTTGNRRR